MHKNKAPSLSARTIAGTMYWIAAGMAVVACEGLLSPTLADDLAVNTGSISLAQGGIVTGLPGETIMPPGPPPGQNPYALADGLKLRGWNVPLPGATNTIDQGLFGLRNTLAANGISYLGFSNTTFQDNMLRHQLPAADYFNKHGRENQLYNGQIPTYATQNYFFALYDLQRFGIPDGQLVFSVASVSTNWAPAGPDGLYLGQVSYYQTFLNKKLEVKVGYLQNYIEFLGTQVGGTLAGGTFGPNGSITYENGLNSSLIPTLGVNIKYNFPNNFYMKGAVQRASSPDGNVVERVQNPTATNLKVSNAGVLFFDEAGYRINPSPGVMQTWLRAAVDVNTSRYRELANTAHREQGEYGLYILADRQLFQTAPNAGHGSARRGIYAGFSIEEAPSYYNRFAQYYEGRVYGFGLIPGRPNDLLSVVVSHSQFSGEAAQTARKQGLLAHDGTTSYTGSYGIQALPGLTVNVGVAFTDHPTAITYNRSTGSALNILLNSVLFF